MADDAPRTLLCLIIGESVLFTVKPTGSLDIIDLKSLIKEDRKEGVLGSVDAKDLILWKVRMSLDNHGPATAQLTFLQVDVAPPMDEWGHLTGKDVPGSVRIEGLDTISSHWPATTPPNPQHLHIIIELPAGKRRVCVLDQRDLTDCVSIALSLIIVRLSTCSNLVSTSSWQAISCSVPPRALRPPMVRGSSLKNLESKRP